MSKILVTGAPGNVGTEVVKALQEQGADFRVGAFNRESAQPVLGDQVEIVPFNFLDDATYEAAFTGVSRLFLVRPPALANVKREILPALVAAKAAGVEQIVFLSIQGVEKNRMVPHYKIEQAILKLGFDYTFLRASFFMQNLSTTHRAEIRERGEIAVPVGNAKTSFIDARDIAAVAAQALTDDRHRNQIYTLTGGEALDYNQVAQILSAVVDHPVQYTRPSAFGFLQQQLAKGQPFVYALVVTGLYTITRMGNAKEVTDDVERILGRKPIAFETFARDFKACWMQSSANAL